METAVAERYVPVATRRDQNLNSLIECESADTHEYHPGDLGVTILG